MIRDIVTDELFLSLPSHPATAIDLPTAQDLLDTLIANSDHCVGLAANMIGVQTRIIVVDDDGDLFVMLNPEIIKASGTYPTEEACLSLQGTRPTKRYKNIKVKYQTTTFQTRIKTYHDFTAQIIQHEIDHCNGIVI